MVSRRYHELVFHQGIDEILMGNDALMARRCVHAGHHAGVLMAHQISRTGDLNAALLQPGGVGCAEVVIGVSPVDTKLAEGLTVHPLVSDVGHSLLGVTSC